MGCPNVSPERPRAVTLLLQPVPCVWHGEGLRWVQMSRQDHRLRALCVGRHPLLSDHFARFFAELGVETQGAVGLEEALVTSREFSPDVVICEYELLAALSLEAWERDELLCRVPVIAVSLTRRPHEVFLLDVNGIGGFLYLPLLDRDAAMRVISAAAASSRVRYPSPGLASAEREAAALR